MNARRLIDQHKGLPISTPEPAKERPAAYHTLAGAARTVIRIPLRFAAYPPITRNAGRAAAAWEAMMSGDPFPDYSAVLAAAAAFE